MNPTEAISIIQKSLYQKYGPDEAKAIAKRYVSDISFIEGYPGGYFNLDVKKFNNDISRLSEGCPVQYVTGVEMFLGRYFQVSPDVLIPRPETEELTEMIIQGNIKKPTAILDMCTGSGCIAVSLSLAFPDSIIWATDYSAEALRMAQINATRMRAEVHFEHADLLSQDPICEANLNFDIMVSNPPYIAEQEKETMDSNVRDFEPHLALFVNGNDPLVFYRRIADIASRKLRSGGNCFVEINRLFGQEVKDIFETAGMGEVIILKDISGNERVVKCTKSY